MAPSRIYRPRFGWSEKPNLGESKTFQLILSPESRGGIASSEISSEALRYRMPGGATDISQTRDLRIFGERPVLQIENSVERSLVETSLVKAERVEKSLIVAEPKIMAKAKPGVLERLGKKKIELGISAALVGVNSVYAYLIYTFPVQAAWVIGGCLAFIFSAALSVFWLPPALRAGGDILRRILGFGMGLPHLLLPEKKLPALPAASEGEGPYRSSGPPAELQNIIRLKRKILTPSENNYERRNEIKLLGISLKDFPTQSPEFRHGVDALHEVLLNPPVIRYSSRYWRENRLELRIAAVQALSVIFNNLDSAYRDPHLVSVAASAVKKLASHEIENYFYRDESFNKYLASKRIQEIRRPFANVLDQTANSIETPRGEK